MTDMNLLADAYDAAADYIEQYGWYQGNYYPSDVQPPAATLGIAWTKHAMITALGTSEVKPPMCMAGALGVYMTEDEWDESGDHFRVVLGDFISVWNDAPSRTKEDVIELLRMEALKIRMGNIGDNPREYEFEPMPTTTPVVEPAAPQPAKEPVPA